MSRKVKRLDPLPKCPTGISGLDEITGGGLPLGRPTLVTGFAGCGKTLLAMEFLVRGATEFNEPGVFMAFEEKAEELARNVASLGFDLDALAARKRIYLDYVRVDRNEIEETGEYNLDGLFVRLDHAIDSIGAKRVVLDTVESLFGGLTNESILRAELRRLFGWLKEKGVTAIVTGERGEEGLTRHGLEEYVADCVVLLDHRVTEQVSTRRLRVVKYRGSRHETNEFPFLIGQNGIFLVPITAMGLDYSVSRKRISTGIAGLDAMLGGKGYYRGSSVLVSGTPGTGKTTVAAHFADAAARRGERCLYHAFEESREQIFRNMRSVGLDLERWARKGLLDVRTARPTLVGLEAHLLGMTLVTDAFRPDVVIIDPITNLTAVASSLEVKAMLSRLIDHYKSRGITTLFTTLVARDGAEENSGLGISSLMDTWLLLQDVESNGERNRGLYILKSRGMPHSNQVREFVMTGAGIHLVDVSLTSGTVLMGSARKAQEAEERSSELLRRQENALKERALEQKRKQTEARIAALEAEYAADMEEMAILRRQEEVRERDASRSVAALARHRQRGAPPAGKSAGKGVAPEARR